MSECKYCGQMFPEDEVPFHFINEFKLGENMYYRCPGGPEWKEVKLDPEGSVSIAKGLPEDSCLPVYLL